MKQHSVIRIIFMAAIAVLVAGTILQVILNWNPIMEAKPPEFSPKNMLQALWHQYKGEYLEADTFRALDRQQGDITTSEGQSYSMLRAVWMDDKETFDRSWQWTKDNLQRKEDHLIAWLFGKKPDGTYGVLADRGGQNTASDADVDVALALLFASKRWNDNAYFGDAIVMIRAIWEREVIEIQGRPYLAANNVEKTVPKQVIVLNPSYFAPYAYKIFDEADPEHDWLGVASTSYEVALESMRKPLDKASSAYLPSDWVGIDRTTGEIVPIPQPTSLTTNFSYDALRLPWRFALDWAWYGDMRAKQVLDSIGFLSGEWQEKGEIKSSYSHEGVELSSIESPAMYGGTLGYFLAKDRKAADSIYSRKLEALYNPNSSEWSKELSYYDENWAWFGMALYHSELPNLFEP